MTKDYIKYLLECKCILPQFKNSNPVVFHKFLVFSEIDTANGLIIPSYAQCNNCGIIHKVTDICTSEILSGKEAMNSIVKIEDIKLSLPPNLADILERNNADVATWEAAQFILENKQWGNFVILAQEEESGTRQGKYVRIMSETFFKVESFSREEVAVPSE